MPISTKAIAALKKYLFGLIVVSYTLTTIGVPVYLHYCGGELERVNFVIKGAGCCGDMDEEAGSSDCCKDENTFLQNTHHFTLKTICYEFPKFSTLLFQLPALQNNQLLLTPLFATHIEIKEPPPKLLNSLLVSTSVLRI